ncbi:MAG: hypothetical protein QXN87_05815 [Candidatus Bathyarchaeia archaeon]
MRVVEVILASFIIVFALSFANILAIVPQSPKYEATELEKMGYNVLYDLDKQGLLTRLVYEKDWHGLQRALQVLLPIDVYFNLTIYYLNGAKVNNIPISSGNPLIFAESKNVASITYGLTGSAQNVTIYDPRILILQLTRG